jgi:hypothetical protein
VTAVVAVMHSGGERGHPLKEGTGIMGQTYNSKKCFRRGFVDNIEVLTEGNTDFRRVLYTAGNTQLVLMALLPG